MSATGGGARVRRRVAAALAVSGLVAGSLALCELFLRLVLGLGHPVLYDSNPLYGFRPRASQVVSRFGGPAIRFNNLGLRCDGDWNADPDRKILFLGDSVTFGGERLSTGELFVARAVEDLPGYESCNGGVNAWGVENIHGLVVETAFLPARYYVSMLIEDDFYRGLVRVQGQLVWCREPALALEELWSDLCYVQSNRRYKHWMEVSRPETVGLVVDKAVRQLRDMDQFLTGRGFVHLVYISPLRDQALARSPRDPVVAKYLGQHGVRARYLVDAIRDLHMDDAATERLFTDHVHLSSAGHALWARIVNADLRRAIGGGAAP